MRNVPRYSCVVIFIVLSFGSIGFAGVISPELESSLNRAAPFERIPVIITMSDQVDISAYASKAPLQRRPALVSALRSLAASKLAPLETFLKSRSAEGLRELWLINGMAAKLPASTVQLLRLFPGIASVRPDEVIQVPQVLAAGAGPVEWNIQAVNADVLWNLGFDGASIVVANIDSGVDLNHADLASRWRGGTNSWYDPNGEHPVTPTDKTGHGTGTMAIMVGGDATGSSIGMAPGAQWIAAKIFNDAGQAATSVIHQAFQWMLDPDSNPSTNDSPDIVNNSWGYPELLDLCYLEFQYDIEALEAAGIAVVFSAGNSGPNPSTSISPANNPDSFAVGSVSDSLAIANTSSRGPSACIIENDFYPEVVAPGVNVKTADLTFSIDPSAFAFVSGTSFAAPHVSGAMALLRQAFPGSSPSELETALMQTAQDLGSVGPDDTYGYGMIDVLAAYQSLVPCTDDDGDGFFVEAVCALELDCNDQDAAVFPGAAEVKHDTIDQDCNGYDLTIDIIEALYFTTTDQLRVTATSSLGGTADLSLDGFGAMTWNGVSNQWETVVAAGGNPGTIKVIGIEGAESTTTATCTDADGYSFFAGATCGTAQDCNDQDPAVYPDAPEVKHDGIDQDCNAYDLTIDIISAVYRSDLDALEVIATSNLGQSAGLQLDNFGTMTFNTTLNQWEIVVTTAGGDPVVVFVSGVEGSESAATVDCTNTCQADFNDDGVINFDDLVLLRSNFGTDCHLIPPEELCVGDANDDLYVNFDDLVALRQEFGRSDCMVCQ